MSEGVSRPSEGSVVPIVPVCFLAELGTSRPVGEAEPSQVANGDPGTLAGRAAITSLQRAYAAPPSSCNLWIPEPRSDEHQPSVAVCWRDRAKPWWPRRSTAKLLGELYRFGSYNGTRVRRVVAPLHVIVYLIATRLLWKAREAQNATEPRGEEGLVTGPRI